MSLLNLGIDGLDELAPLLPMSKTWSFIDSGCPELLAAHLEVSNSIAKILLSSRHSYATSEQLKLPSIINHLFVQDAFEEFLILMKTYPSVIASIQGIPRTPNIAIACNAVVRRSVFTSALRKDITGLRNVVCFAASLEIEIALAAIDVVPDAWRSYASVDSLFGLVKTYMGAIEMTQSPEVRAAAIFSLAEIVDRLYGHMDSKIVGQGHGDGSAKVPTLPSLEFNEMVRNEINGLGALLQDGIAKTPSLSNAEIRISGSLLVCEYVSLKHFNRTLSSYKSRMEAWAKLLVRAGRSHNVSPGPKNVFHNMLNPARILKRAKLQQQLCLHFSAILILNGTTRTMSVFYPPFSPCMTRSMTMTMRSATSAPQPYRHCCGNL